MASVSDNIHGERCYLYLVTSYPERRDGKWEGERKLQTVQNKGVSTEYVKYVLVLNFKIQTPFSDETLTK
jgi:hypothetical protein